MRLRAALRALVAIAIAASSVLATAAPAAALHGKERIIGKVTDAATGAALDNVCVVLGPSAARCWTSTNSAGDYLIDLREVAPPGFSSPVQFFRAGYTTASQTVNVNSETDTVLNMTLSRSDGGSGAAPPASPPPNVVQPAPPHPAGTTPPVAPVTPVVTPAPAVNIEQRIADFWKRIDALAPTDNVSAGDLGGWALNVIERNPRARLTAADFRTSTAGMQAGLDRAGLGPVPAVTPTPVANIEQRIADFWTRIGALQPTDHVSAADLGQWALNVIGRIPRAQLSAADFRTSTASMQGGFDRAGLAPLP